MLKIIIAALVVSVFLVIILLAQAWHLDPTPARAIIASMTSLSGILGVALLLHEIWE
jgi:uncharacterized membrane protein